MTAAYLAAIAVIFALLALAVYLIFREREQYSPRVDALFARANELARFKGLALTPELVLLALILTDRRINTDKKLDVRLDLRGIPAGLVEALAKKAISSKGKDAKKRAERFKRKAWEISNRQPIQQKILCWGDVIKAMIAESSICKEVIEAGARESGCSVDRFTDEKLPAILVSGVPPQYTHWVVGPRAIFESLTASALKGKFADIYPRVEYAKRMLTAIRARQSILLLGPKGVGKTYLIRTLAVALIASRDLSDWVVLELTSFSRSFRKDLPKIVTLARNKKVIVFIDEAHRVSKGSTDDFKRMLADGEIILALATTDEEAKDLLEGDEALERRFDRIMVEEPNIEETAQMLASLFQSFWNVPRDAAVGFLEKLGDLVHQWVRGTNPARTAWFVRRLGGNFKQPSPQAVAKLIAAEVNLPIITPEVILGTGATQVKGLSDALRYRVRGQDHAVDVVARAAERWFSGLRDPNKPIGSFLFLGPSGVGKTELAKALATLLFKNRLLRIDMTEFDAPHTVSRFVGAPPGYVGYEEGGQLTEPLRRTPYQVVLLDEIGRSDPKVLEVLFPFLDDARITDGRGNVVWCGGAMTIGTSNIPVHENLPSGFWDWPLRDQDMEIRRRLIAYRDPKGRQHFPPPLVNRWDHAIVFRELSVEVRREIIELHLQFLAESFGRRKRVRLQCTERVLDILATTCWDKELGARPAKRIIEEDVMLAANRCAAGSRSRGKTVIVDFDGSQFVARLV